MKNYDNHMDTHDHMDVLIHI